MPSDMLPAVDPLRLLVVDADAARRERAALVLGAAGHAVTGVSSGEAALELCGHGEIDAVVSATDTGSLGGLQLCRLLRRTGAGVPVAVVSEDGHPRDRFWAKHAGADACVRRAALAEDLDEMLSGVKPGRATRRRGGGPAQRADALLSALMEELLFSAVLTSEVQRIVAQCDDRRSLARELVTLAAEVVDAPYLVVEIGSARARSWTVLARAPWREAGADASLRALGVVEPDAADVLVDEVMDAPSELTCAGAARIALGREELGSVTAFGGRLLPDRDRATLELLARESGLIVKNAILREEAAALARTDALTGIANRREASERLEIEFERVRRHGGELSVAICDVDRFKSVNDTYGHGAGDDVLRTVARTLAKTARKTDLVARWGGEEFLVVLTSTHRAGAVIAAERMRSNLEAAPGAPQVTMSVGVASAPASSIASLLARADAALYRAKHEGRNCVRSGESE